MKVLSNHKVVPIAQKSALPIVVQCDTHIGHVRDLYCPECKVSTGREHLIVTNQF